MNRRSSGRVDGRRIRGPGHRPGMTARAEMTGRGATPGSDPFPTRPGQPELVRLPAARYLAVDGRDRPGSARFRSAMRSLYSVGYTMKFARPARGPSFRLGMPQGLYPFPPARHDRSPSDGMRWTLLLRIPEDVRRPELRASVSRLRARGRDASGVRLVRLREGRVVQMLHVGPYSAERGSVESMTRWARARGLTLRAPLHEIYLSDPRRTPARRLRTVLRFPLGPSRMRPARRNRARSARPT
jgi:hypothetical protein